MAKKETAAEQLSRNVEECFKLYHAYAKLQMSMHYELFYEMVSEGENPYVGDIREMADALHGMIHTYFSEELTEKNRQALSAQLLELRRGVIDRMQVLTAYVDRFTVYEYVLNRVQYRFEDREALPEDSVFAQKLVQFIFSGKDNAVINDNIKFVVGQLPVRMTRSHYFDIVKNSISVYQGSDKSSLDSFRYMFRTSAMLYRDENMNRYLTEFVPVLEELEALEYETIDAGTYTRCAGKIRENAAKLDQLSDLYMQLGQLMNEMYILLGTPNRENGEEQDPAEKIIRSVNDLFLGQEQAQIQGLDDCFAAVEGRQEEIYEKLLQRNAAVEKKAEAQADKLVEAGLFKKIDLLRKFSLLTSNSIFADLEEQADEEKVTEQMAEQCAAELIAECKAFFQGKSRLLRRAVMANTLEKLPVFFTSPQEVADYVMDTLRQCDDESEKYAAKQLLLDIME